MNILVEIQHPAHVHHFKNMIWNLKKKGHKVKICTTDKDVSISLLKNYNLQYELLGKNKGKSRLFGKVPLLVGSQYKMLKIACEFKPDIFISRGSPISGVTSKILKKPYVISCDSEPGSLLQMISFPLANAIYIPSSFNKDLKNNKVIIIDGYKELAYLHPNYFTPDPDIFDDLGINKGDKYVLLRFVAWGAYHDVGKYGIEDKIEFINELQKYTSNIFISSELPLPSELEKYKLTIKTSKIHDVLFNASLLICDSQTMTTESALLGTPAIRCNSFVGDNDMGNFIELEQKYGLIFNYNDSKKALLKAVELLQKPNLKESWVKKRELLLKDKIDVTGFITWFIENYPQSFTLMKDNPDFQYQFKSV